MRCSTFNKLIVFFHDVFFSGGSALLSLPIKPLTLQDKLDAVKTLASKSATIQEINIVRKNISAVKGGRLAEAAKPAKVGLKNVNTFLFLHGYTECYVFDTANPMM